VNGLFRGFLVALVLLAALLAAVSGVSAAPEGGSRGFQIKAFDVTGNTIFPEYRLTETVAPFIGSEKTAADVEKARDALEKLYHDNGYPAVIVNIPEQTLEDGRVKLEVIESRIGRVKITGNRYFTIEKVMKDLPSFTPGGMLYLPNVQMEVGRLNRSQNIKVDPVMSPGRDVGTIDVELKVEDTLPLHGYLELNNRASRNTSPLRLNGMVRYDNLWQKEHSLLLQYQTAPLDAREVEMEFVSYTIPAIWDEDDQLALYGVWSNSNTAFGEGFLVKGVGEIFGTRYVRPLPPHELYTHILSLGIDYKHLTQDTGFQQDMSGAPTTPITYTLLSFSYSSSLPDEWGGTTQFTGGLNMSVREAGSDQAQYDEKRYKATGNFVYGIFGIQRAQTLPLGMSLMVKVDGQEADQPLVDSEQYVAGGMESVRGYKESDASGDDAVHGIVELSFPNPLEKTNIAKWLQLTPYIFYDAAALTILDPLPEQQGSIHLEGAGAGLRGAMAKYLEYEVNWAVALHPTDFVKRNSQEWYFKVKAVF
jgi:hemolysin activation/secretion protein